MTGKEILRELVTKPFQTMSLVVSILLVWTAIVAGPVEALAIIQSLIGSGAFKATATIQ